MDGTPHRFRLERVRALRERSEDQAKQALADSLLQERQAEAGVAAAAAEISAARTALSGSGVTPVDAVTIRAHQAYLERAERLHRQSVVALQGTQALTESRRDELVEAARARQTLDRLHDRSLAAHRAESGRRERALLDEIALNTFRRGAAA
ncbi:MAG TPA: flagellar export protein FliJ [Solirubrobacteraceae bacterium]|nr:flagellar export protein FliJ [Solirubrobacteraceae bacterium]